MSLTDIPVVGGFISAGESSLKLVELLPLILVGGVIIFALNQIPDKKR